MGLSYLFPMSARAFTAGEISTLSHHFGSAGNTRDRLLVILGAATGLRARELVGIRVSDVWTGTAVVQELYIQRCRLKYGRSAKRRAIRGRRIPLADPVRDAVTDHLAVIGVFDPDHAVFSSRESHGQSMTTEQAYRRLRQGCVACGIPLSGVSLGSLRRHFAQSCYSFTHCVLTVQRCMGHSSPLTTAIYLNADQTRADDTIRALGNRMGQPLPAAGLAAEA